MHNSFWIALQVYCFLTNIWWFIHSSCCFIHLSLHILNDLSLESQLTCTRHLRKFIFVLQWTSLGLWFKSNNFDQQLKYLDLQSMFIMQLLHVKRKKKTELLLSLIPPFTLTDVHNGFILSSLPEKKGVPSYALSCNSIWHVWGWEKKKEKRKKKWRNIGLDRRVPSSDFQKTISLLSRNRLIA